MVINMCGIAGICNYNVDPKKNIEKMNDAIIRRGPDAGNYYVDDNNKIVLGHRRLSILDLSENGAQPMKSRDERYIIVYNGEIYNYKEIYNKMITEDVSLSLRGTSDTELLLEAIAHYGLDETLKLAKGMFAIALYDRKEKAIELARDRMGEKPLYYGNVNGSFVFASDLNAIKVIDNFNNQINKDVLRLYFRLGYIPAPYTIYKDIYKLKPGTIIRLETPFRNWTARDYWNIKEVALNGEYNQYKGSFEEATIELEEIIKGAIKGQMISDVPLGAFLSGGVDSTLVVSLMQAMNPLPVKTFTIGMKEDSYNEASFAKETAKHLGTIHEELYVGYDEIMDIIPRLSTAYSEPFADSSQIPTMLVSKMTRENVMVSLSGDAGDELFCGYNSYLYAKKGYNVIKSKGKFLPGNMRRDIGEMASLIAGRNTPFLGKLGDVFTINTIENYFRAINSNPYKSRFLVKNPCELENDYSNYISGYLTETEHNLMLMDMLQYLPDDILTKVDRAGMYYSLETRVPLLDRDVIEFAWSLPLSYKYENNITKRILREILYKYVPREMMERPKKGFSVPIGEWLLKGEMHEWAESVMTDANLKTPDIIDKKISEQLWTQFKKDGKYSTIIWYLLMYNQWMLDN